MGSAATDVISEGYNPCDNRSSERAPNGEDREATRTRHREQQAMPIATAVESRSRGRRQVGAKRHENPPRKASHVQSSCITSASTCLKDP
jgi:hypothetical protein